MLRSHLPTVLIAALSLSSCVIVSDHGSSDWDDDGHHEDGRCCETASPARRTLNLDGRDDERPFSHAVLAGDTLYVAGSLGLDAETGLPPEDVEQEVRLMLDSFAAKLALADMEMEDLVSVQVFCSDTSLYGAFNDVYRTYFDGSFPARAFIGSGPLLFGARFEINGIAVRR